MVVSVGLALRSVDALNTARAELRAATVRRAELADLQHAVMLLPQDSQPPRDLATALGALSVTLLSHQSPDQVELSVLGPGTDPRPRSPGPETEDQHPFLSRSGETGMRSLAELARPAPLVPGLASVRLEVRGSYRSLDGLQRYLSAFAVLPVAIRALTVEGQTFFLQLEVFGRQRTRS